MNVRSGYCSPEHKLASGSATRSRQLDGAAFDIDWVNHNPVAFEKAARDVGFIRVDLGPVRQLRERLPVCATGAGVGTTTVGVKELECRSHLTLSHMWTTITYVITSSR